MMKIQVKKSLPSLDLFKRSKKGVGGQKELLFREREGERDFLSFFLSLRIKIGRRRRGPHCEFRGQKRKERERGEVQLPRASYLAGASQSQELSF